MEPFTRYQGKIVVMLDDNVDTDRIIPARFLSRISKLGYGELVFMDVRGSEFALDRPEASGASILVVGTNFGCGSSREHAVWAIQQSGFKAVISLATPTSPGYSDIFRQNSANCGLLLIEVGPEEHAKLAAKGTGYTLEIDLPGQTITGEGLNLSFEINPVNKDALVKGLDLIGTTLEFEDAISAYEENKLAFTPAR